VPFRDVPYAEDQLLGRDLIEAGYAKVFHPGARVIHSHHYGPFGFLRRYFDEYRGLREVLGYREPAKVRHMVRSVQFLVHSDKKWLEGQGVKGFRREWALFRSWRHHTIRLLGAMLGSHADRLPPSLRRILSLERRATFVPRNLGQSPLLASDPGIDVRPNWGWEFVRRSSGGLRLERHSGRNGGPLTIAWVIPPWGIGSGGHAAIFKLVAELEWLGHSCAIFVFDPFEWNDRPGHELREEIREHFTWLEAPVFVSLDDFDSADIAIATNWWTAYPVRDLCGCREKVYLVQDYEPAFYPTSAEGLWAEATYRMGYRGVAYTPWLADILRNYGLDVAELECGTDLETYQFAGTGSREKDLIVVYARRETPRRHEGRARALLPLGRDDPGRQLRRRLCGRGDPMRAVAQ
jgi:hypothetical protein